MRASRTHGNAHFPCERAHIHFRTESPPSFQENHNLSTRAGAEGHAPNAITHDTDTRKLVSSSARRSARLWDVLTVSELPVPRFAAARALCGRSGKGNELGPEGNRRGLLCERWDLSLRRNRKLGNYLAGDWSIDHDWNPRLGRLEKICIP